jgi:hypothetical protein
VVGCAEARREEIRGSVGESGKGGSFFSAGNRTPVTPKRKELVAVAVAPLSLSPQAVVDCSLVPCEAGTRRDLAPVAGLAVCTRQVDR